jgi:hypothetical protein
MAVVTAAATAAVMAVEMAAEGNNDCSFKAAGSWQAGGKLSSAKKLAASRPK